MASLKKRVKRWLRKKNILSSPPPSSFGYDVILGEMDPVLSKGFQVDEVAKRQRDAFSPLLKDLERGEARLDFKTLAAAVDSTAVQNPEIIEIGCGSGWNSEVLTRLLNRPFGYIGLDYSSAMISLAQRDYSRHRFLVGNATALPFREKACDILLSGTVLMHLPQYAEAIRESRRITRRWCVFHTVPTLQLRETTRLRKVAYGEPVFEVIFNEEELMACFANAGFVVRSEFPSIPYDLRSVLGEPTATKTYVCETVDQ